MTPFQIEQKRIELLSSLQSICGRTKLWHLYDFYFLLLETNDNSLIDSYSPEFIEELIYEVDHFNSLYSPPQKTETLIQLINRIHALPILAKYQSKLTELQSNLIKELEQLNNLLAGNDVNISVGKITFPLLEKIGEKEETGYGILESVKIKIGKAKGRASFVIIPSPQKVNEQLERQVNISFTLALEYLKSFKHKFHQHHEVIIVFENRAACYEGNSLAIALTLGFIEELTLHYNLPYLVHIKDGITSTGGLSETGDVIPVSTNHIEKKVETVFFSPVQQFVIPKADEAAAEAKLSLLKESYPNRNLKLVPLNSLTDLLDRRSIIEIKKQALIVRSAKTIKKNWLTSLLLMLLLLISVFIWQREQDNNPSITSFESNNVLIKNKMGKLLWKKQLNIGTSTPPLIGVQNQLVRLIDVNSDGFNEVLVCKEKFEIDKDSTMHGSISCYDNNGDVIWCYRFNEIVRTAEESYSDRFCSYLIDTLTENKKKSLYLFACDELEFPAAIYKLDLQTGKRLEGVLWNSGSIYSAIFKRYPSINKTELIVGCANNTLKVPSVFNVDTRNIEGQNYATGNYKFLGIKDSKLENCIFLPKTDYSIYKQQYINHFVDGSLEDKTSEKCFYFNIWEGDLSEDAILLYNLEYDFSDVSIDVNSHLRVRRDSLVAKGILDMPLTDTQEYKDMLKKQIIKWDGKRFTTHP